MLLLLLLPLSSMAIFLYDDKLANGVVFVIDTGCMSTGVDKISRCCFFGAAGFDASFRFLMDGIVNDCSVITVLDCEGCADDDDDGVCVAACNPLPNVDCTKFVEFLKSFVKLLVLNDSNPLDVSVDGVVGDDDKFDDEDDGVDAAFAVGGKVDSTLPRTDFVLWLNIILTFSHV